MTANKPPSANLRRTLYWTEDTEAKIIKIAEKLHAQGVKGLYTGKGEVNRMAVIRHLIEKELDQELTNKPTD